MIIDLKAEVSGIFIPKVKTKATTIPDNSVVGIILREGKADYEIRVQQGGIIEYLHPRGSALRGNTICRIEVKAGFIAQPMIVGENHNVHTHILHVTPEEAGNLQAYNFNIGDFVPANNDVADIRGSGVSVVNSIPYPGILVATYCNNGDPVNRRKKIAAISVATIQPPIA